METEYLVVNKANPDKFIIKKAARLLQQGEIVAFPTETVYGLGANALDENAVRKIFLAKGRPSDNPLIVHVAGIAQLVPLVKEVSHLAQSLIDRFWPGPLTLIFPKSNMVPSVVTAGLKTVAIRMPEHPVALELIRQAHLPVAAPSANVSGRPSPTSGHHVWQDLKGKVALVLDGGETRVGLESTVLDITNNPPLILRPGEITLDDLQRIIGNVEWDKGLGNIKKPRSPGMKYTHYSPNADVFVVSGKEENLSENIISTYHRFSGEGKKVAVLVSQETAEMINGMISPVYLEILGSREDLTKVARKLFSSFRNSDSLGADVVLIEEFPEDDIGKAIMNRVRKAAGNKVIK